jgi:hypothetical protein
MESLINLGAADPAAWLNGQGFSNSQPQRYWTSTTQAGPFPAEKWTVSLEPGVNRPIYTYNFNSSQYVWPVRAGQRDYANRSYPANVWKTGQKASRYPNDDGALEMGVTWPAERFTDHGDGTVTDNLTKLMWLKDANCFASAMLWQDTLDTVSDFNSDPGSYDCEEYTAAYKDWHLPNRKELLSLVDRSKYYYSALPTGHPFVNQESQYHGHWWTSTTDPSDDRYAYRIHLSGTAVMEKASKTVNPVYLWPVRGTTDGVSMLWILLLLDD